MLAAGRAGEARPGQTEDVESPADSARGTFARNMLESVPRLGLIVAASGISLMVVLIIAEIVSTKLFNFSLPYVLEYSEYLIAIIVFWGAAYTLSRGGHVRADILVHRLPERTREWVFLIGYVIGLAFLLVVLHRLLEVAWLSFKTGRYSFYPAPSPLGPPQMAAALGLAVFAFQLLVEIVRKARQLYARHRSDSSPRS